MSFRRLLAVVCLLFGCSPASPPVDGGVAAEASVPDLGDLRDQGLHPDAGPEPDAGPAGPDDPIRARPLVWTYVDVPGSKCMNGSQTGFAARLNPASNNVMIFLMGGGACFNRQTCGSVAGQEGYTRTEFLSQRGLYTLGVFDTRDPENPFKDWNQIFVPYCSGDVFAGDNPNGPGGRVFQGYRNIGLFMRRIVPSFPNATHVLLTGVSAGGFGAAFNYDRIAQAFGPSVDVTLVDDSGPPMGDEYMKTCLQSQWKTWWNLDATLPADCAECRRTDGGGIGAMAIYLANKYPNRRLALISGTTDGTIRTFYGFGYSPDCMTQEIMEPEAYTAGLLDMRTRLQPYPNFKQFLIGDPDRSSTHTWIALDYHYSWDNTEVSQWMNAAVMNTAAFRNAGP